MLNPGNPLPKQTKNQTKPPNPSFKVNLLNAGRWGCGVVLRCLMMMTLLEMDGTCTDVLTQI